MNALKTLKTQIIALPIFSAPQYARYRMFFVPLFVVIIASLITLLVTAPQIVKLLKTSQDLKDLEEKKQFYIQKASELENLNVEDYRNNLDTSLIALPVDKDIPGVMGELLVSLSGSGMSLLGISFSNSPPESDKLQEYSILLNVTGSEDNLRNFLERVTVAPRLIKLSSIEVSKGAGENFTIALSFATFYQILPGDIGSIDDELPKISASDTQFLADIQAKVKTFQTVANQAAVPVAGKSNPFSP